MKWQRIGPRTYKAAIGNDQAYVFSSPRLWIWAWCVWLREGKGSGVELCFRDAKTKAEELIARRAELKP